MDANKEMKNHVIKIGILVVSIITIGISMTYAFYTAKISGEANVDTVNAAEFHVTSTLENATAISNKAMNLIDAADINTKADKVEFSVTNDSTSTVSGQYFVSLFNIKLSKNLYSEYFKWQLVRKTSLGESVIDSGNFNAAERTDTPVAGEASNVETTVKDITLNNIALEIPAGTTDNLVFRIWLENDANANQVDLTNGSFKGQLKITASPKSQNH